MSSNLINIVKKFKEIGLVVGEKNASTFVLKKLKKSVFPEIEIKLKYMLFHVLKLSMKDI